MAVVQRHGLALTFDRVRMSGAVEALVPQRAWRRDPGAVDKAPRPNARAAGLAVLVSLGTGGHPRTTGRAAPCTCLQCARVVLRNHRSAGSV